MVIEYFFKAYTIIYFTILPPLFEYLGCFQFLTKQLFDEYFSAYGFSIFQGIFLGEIPRRGLFSQSVWTFLWLQSIFWRR